jgi:hypothetical protein
VKPEIKIEQTADMTVSARKNRKGYIKLKYKRLK